MAYSLGWDHKTVLRTGVGLFYDRVSLLASTFTQNPTRVVTMYDQAGVMVGKATILQNAYLDFDSTGPAIRTSGDPGSARVTSPGTSR